MASRVGSPSERNKAAAGANSTFVTASDSTGIAIGRCYRLLVTFGPNGCMLERSGVTPRGLPAKGVW